MKNAQDSTVYTSAVSEFSVSQATQGYVVAITGPGEASADGDGAGGNGTPHIYTATHQSTNCNAT